MTWRKIEPQKRATWVGEEWPDFSKEARQMGTTNKAMYQRTNIRGIQHRDGSIQTQGCLAIGENMTSHKQPLWVLSLAEGWGLYWWAMQTVWVGPLGKLWTTKWEQIEVFYLELVVGRNLKTSRGLGRRRQWHPTKVFLPGESQGQGSLVGCCLWDRTESDTTEVT